MGRSEHAQSHVSTGMWQAPKVVDSSLPVACIALLSARVFGVSLLAAVQKDVDLKLLVMSCAWGVDTRLQQESCPGSDERPAQAVMPVKPPVLLHGMSFSAGRSRQATLTCHTRKAV